MRTHLRLAVLLAALAAPALAQHGRFSAFGGEPLPQGTSLIHAQFGWPGLSATFLTGTTPRASFGGRFTFNYGFEGQVAGLDLGLKFQGLFRLGLVDTGKVSLGIDVAPGIALYFPNGGAFTQVGIALPVTLVLGIPLGDALALHAAIDLPLLVTFSNPQTFWIPIYLGGGLEYALDKSLMLTLDLRMGPQIDARLSRPYFGLNASFGIAFKL